MDSLNCEEYESNSKIVQGREGSGTTKPFPARKGFAIEGRKPASQFHPTVLGTWHLPIPYSYVPTACVIFGAFLPLVRLALEVHVYRVFGIDILCKMVTNWHLLLESERINEEIFAEIYKLFKKCCPHWFYPHKVFERTDSVLNGEIR